ncbi:MAG: pyrroline-5-carboxylate reductase [Phycisphaerae bacterium]|nr:pyrroline-5-carboxylate reductase [Phycisphaerae bacterium]
MSTTLSVIGAGNMASAIIRGAIDGQILLPSQIFVADPSEDARAAFAEFGCTVFADAKDLPETTHCLLAVKPQIFPLVSGAVNAEVVYSIMAGISIQQIQDETGKTSVVRVMPNLPCQLGLGAAGLACAKEAVSEDATLAIELFNSIGIVEEVDESLMNAVTAVSGSGPAYIFLLAEAMMKGAIEAGLSASTANALVRQTIKGAAEMLTVDKHASPEKMRAAVTSKGGTTHAAIESMKESGVPEGIANGVIAARNRGIELGKS